MSKYTFIVVLLPFLIIGCTRSTISNDVSAPPTAILGTNMLTLETSQITSTRTNNLGNKKTLSVVTSTKIHSGVIKTPETTRALAVTPSEKSTTSITETPPPTPTTKLPAGVPVDNWREIPIMPDAVSGDEEADRYRYMLKGTVDQVEEFYKEKLIKLGWKFDVKGTGENGAPIFIFSKSGKVLSITVIAIGDIVVVSLAPI